MPRAGRPHTGHGDHEFMTVDRLRLNPRMRTAALVELAGQPARRGPAGRPRRRALARGAS